MDNTQNQEQPISEVEKSLIDLFGDKYADEDFPWFLKPQNG